MARNGTFGSGSGEASDFPSSASVSSASAAAEHKPGKFWRPFAPHSSSSAAAAAAEARGTAPVSGSGSAGLPRSSSGGALGLKSQAQHGSGGSSRWRKLHPSSSADGGFNSDGACGGFSPEDGGVWGTGGDGGVGQRAQRSKRSLPSIGAWRRSSEPASSAVLGAGRGILSPPPPPPPRSRVRQRPSSGSSSSGGGGGANAGADGDGGDDDGARSWLPGGGKKGRERRGTASDIQVRGGGAASGDDDSGGESFETVAKVPPWMEGVEASADYEEMKPTLDVIKRTVLLAMLQQVGSTTSRTCVCVFYVFFVSIARANRLTNANTSAVSGDKTNQRILKCGTLCRDSEKKPDSRADILRCDQATECVCVCMFWCAALVNV